MLFEFLGKLDNDHFAATLSHRHRPRPLSRAVLTQFSKLMAETTRSGRPQHQQIDKPRWVSRR